MTSSHDRTTRSDDKRDARGQGFLCAVAFVCYSTTIGSLVALGYSLSALALSAAGQQIAAVYTTLGSVAR
jgi:hypothetical protein